MPFDSLATRGTSSELVARFRYLLGGIAEGPVKLAGVGVTEDVKGEAGAEDVFESLGRTVGERKRWCFVVSQIS